jgi:hypothetical protein
MNFLNLFPVPLYRFDHQLPDNERDDIVNLFLNIDLIVFVYVLSGLLSESCFRIPV